MGKMILNGHEYGSFSSIIESIDDLFDYTQLWAETLNPTITDSQNNEIKTFQINSTGFYLFTWKSTYQRNQNREYFDFRTQSGGVMVFNNGETGMTDVKCDTSGYSEFTRTVLLKVTSAPAVIRIGMWGQSYSPTAITLRLFKLHGFVKKYSHNYSTNEQVIGTWIDGKPLYEKTIIKAYNELATHGIRKALDLREGDTTRVIQTVSAFALSPTFGRCYLGCNAYDSNTANSAYFSLHAYYSMLAVETSTKTLASLDNYSPSIQAIVQYTKNTD